jgi:CDGSH-type Zn-finger protein
MYPLVIKTQVVSEQGEPLTWQTDGAIAVSAEEYHLWRCGQPSNQPCCDGTHEETVRRQMSARGLTPPAIRLAAHEPDAIMLGAVSLLVDAFLRTPPVAQV